MLQHYQNFFYAVNADTPKLRSLACRLRYQVYAEEYGEEVCQTGIGLDEYDDDALHGLIFHKQTDMPVGCIRVIPYRNDSNKHLPLENFCNDFDTNLFSLSELRKQGTGEISRMAIVPSFRRRAYDISFPFSDKNGTSTSHQRLKMNYLPLCLMLIAKHLTLEAELTTSLALMEPKLAKLLTRYGIKLDRIGKLIDLHGQRAPFKLQLESQYLRPEFQKLYSLIGQELKFSRNIHQISDLARA